MRIRVVRHSDLCSKFQLFHWGLLLGIAAGFVFLVITAALLRTGKFAPGEVVPPACAAILVGMPLYLLYRYGFQIGSAARAVLAGAGFGSGLSFALQILVIMLFQRGRLQSALLLEAACLGLLLLCAALCWVCWRVLRNVDSGVVFQDGTRCPQCAYCLKGNASMVCPECGRAYKASDLDG